MSQPGLRVLRVCSVFQAWPGSSRGKGMGFDPVGGMQNHTGELSRALDNLGVVQTVVTARRPNAPRYERVGRNLDILRLGLATRRFRQLYWAPAVRHAFARAASADVVHVHAGEDLVVIPIGLAAARLHGLPLVLTIHCSLRHTLSVGDPRSALLRVLGGWIEEHGGRRADAVIALTSRLARLVESRGFDPSRIHVIPPGVKRSLFKGPFEDPLPHVKGRRVVFVGRLQRAKGLATLIETAALSRTDGLQVVIVGDGPERPALERRIAQLGLGDRVLLIGFVDHDLIPAHLAHADVVLLPSAYEELGSVLLEAVQLGVPIVASDTGGIPSVVRNGANGFLVTPGDARGFASAIDRILGDGLLHARLVEGALARAPEFDWDAIAGRVLDVYRDVVPKGPAWATTRVGASRQPPQGTVSAAG
ncbi:MAG: glycosyltransferase family 4 protein [Actinobacteria bacterium]|nr:glycosyltransferase family 4 protein [Actinomycetota bacterium]